MRTIHRSLAAFCLITAAAVLALGQDAPAPPQGKEVKLTGVVLEGDKPVSGATVGMFWAYDGKEFSCSGGAATNDKGEFNLQSIVWPRRIYKLMALNADQSRGALVVYKSDEAEKPFSIKLGPMICVTAAASCPELKQPGAGVYCNFFTKEGQQYLAGVRADDKGRFAMPLPAGEYLLRIPPTNDTKAHNQTIAVAGEKPLKLKDIDLEASLIGLSYGKPAPALSVTAARNLPPALAEKGARVQWSDFKGKWVLVDFWGFW